MQRPYKGLWDIMKKVLIIVLVLAAVVAVVVFVLPSVLPRPGAQADVGGLRVVPVKRGELLGTVMASGNLSARAEMTLSFRISGEVKAVHVARGEKVAAGQVLLELDTSDLELDVAKARVSLASAEAQLAKTTSGASDAELAAAQASLESALENLAKVQAGPSAEEIAAAEANLQSAREKYAQLQAGPSADDRAQADANLEKARLALQAAQVAYADDANDPDKAANALAAYQRAQLDYEVAVASYNLATQGASDADLQGALAQIRQAEESLARLEASPSAADIAAGQSQVAQAQSQLDKLTGGASAEDIAISQAQVEQARLSLQQAERRLLDDVLVAPFAGTVTDVGVEAGEYVSPSQAALTITDLAALQVEAPVAEVDVARVQPGQEVEVTLDALRGVALRGVVTYISPVATVAQGVVNYAVTIEIADPDPAARPGMTAAARIVVERRQDVLLVPALAVRPLGGEQVVEVVSGDEVVARVVTLGGANDTMVEVMSGLSEGEQVVLRPAEGALPGAPSGFFMGPGRGNGGGN